MCTPPLLDNIYHDATTDLFRDLSQLDEPHTQNTSYFFKIDYKKIETLLKNIINCHDEFVLILNVIVFFYYLTPKEVESNS
jgi:hypothetical protein